MDNVQLSQVNQAYIVNQAENKNATMPIQPQVPQVEDGENKMNKVLLGLGVLGAAAIGITCAIRGKQIKKQPKADDVQKLVKEFGDINFNKGTAKLKDGTLFTGTVEKVSKNGDKLSMEYVDGILKKSSNKVNGTETIKEYTNGIVIKKNGQDIDIKKVQNEVRSQQEKLKNLLANNELSSQDFKMQTDEIKFKSKKQEAEIKSIFDKKVEAQNAAKAEADRLAQEAKEKAQKEEAERLAKEQDEAVQRAKKETQEAQQNMQAQKSAKRAAEIQNVIERNKRINAQVDELMAQSDIGEKLEKLLHTQVTVTKGRYNCELIDTTIDDALSSSILGEYTKPVQTLYHGTNQDSYKKILENGFSLDACHFGESGKGIYFGINQSGAEKYSVGGLIKANYTGDKVANVKAGTLESLQYNYQVRDLFEEVFGIPQSCNDADHINTEILNRIYTKKLSDLGYDAVHSISAGAGCEYIAVLNPDKIKIIN